MTTRILNYITVGLSLSTDLDSKVPRKVCFLSWLPTRTMISKIKNLRITYLIWYFMCKSVDAQWIITFTLSNNISLKVENL